MFLLPGEIQNESGRSLFAVWPSFNQCLTHYCRPLASTNFSRCYTSKKGGGGREERHTQAETLCTHATAKYLLLHSEAIPPFSSSAQGKQFFLSGSILLCTTWWWYLHLGHQLKIREEKISWNANYKNLGTTWRINLIWNFGFGILSFGP